MNTDLVPQTVIDAIRSVLVEADGFIPLHEPLFQGHEWQYVKECIDSGWVSSVGSFVDRFERDLADYTGVKHAVAVVNGTAALHVCLLLAGVQAQDEVLVPALTFVATANAVRYCNAVPHFVDVCELTLGIDVGKLAAWLRQVADLRGEGCFNRQTGRRIAAVVPMHAFGHPVDLDPLLDLCNDYRLTLIEDAAESLGSAYKGRHTGNWGQLSAVSFNGNKVITTGGGGAILTNDGGLAAAAKHLTTTAKLPHRWEFNHDRIGYNYRMPNINAALGCAQLEQLPAMLGRKRSLAERYAAAFRNLPGVRFFIEPSFARSNYWLNCLLLDADQEHMKELLLSATNDAGIMTRPAWTLMHRLPMYTDCPRAELTGAETLEARLISIPSSAMLAPEGSNA